MPTLHKITYTDEITLNEPQANFIAEFCPEHGQMGEGGAYYINAEVLEDLREIAGQLVANKPELEALIRLIEPIIKSEGLYEFYLED